MNDGVPDVAGRVDPEAGLMRALYDEHAAALWRYAIRLTGDAARAEDVVQETLLRAWQHQPAGLRANARGAGSAESTGGQSAASSPADDTEKSARAWLFTVARNMIIDERRSARFRREFGSAEGPPDQAGPDEVNAALDRLLLGGALAQLTAEHRAVIRLSYYQGLTTAQIAAELQIAEGTVKSRLHYAVRALRLTLREMGVTR